MSMTRRQVCLLALTEIGVAQRDVDVSADEYATACRRLDMMVARWNAAGLHLGYPIPLAGEVNLNADTALPAHALEAVVACLAVKLAPSYGKTVSRETKQTASEGFQTLMSFSTIPPDSVMRGGMPLGGRQPTPFWPQFTREPDPNLIVGDDTDLEF